MSDGPLSENALRPPGWYGKLACLGDFATRRLQPGFVARLDAWLQTVIAGSRAQLQQQWLESYLSAPVWHFVEWPDKPSEAAQAGAHIHLGVLMPSVDRVGRYFPLCIVASTDCVPSTGAQWTALLKRPPLLARAALETLRNDQDLETFEAALHAQASPLAGGDDRTGSTEPSIQGLRALLSGSQTLQWSVLEHAGAEGIGSLFATLSTVSLSTSLSGASFWWADTQPGGRTHAVICRGRPDVQTFCAMLRNGSDLQGLDTPDCDDATSR